MRGEGKIVPPQGAGPRTGLGVLGDLAAAKAMFQQRTLAMLLQAPPAGLPAPEPKAKGSNS